MNGAMNPMAKEFVAFLGRVGARAVAAAADSVAEDVDRFATNVSKKAKKAKKKLQGLPREREHEVEIEPDE